MPVTIPNFNTTASISGATKVSQADEQLNLFMTDAKTYMEGSYNSIATQVQNDVSNSATQAANSATQAANSATQAANSATQAANSASILSAATAHIASTSNPHNVTKTQVGLGNVDNTSDLNKPISTATQTALNLKAPLASPALTGTPTAPTAKVNTSSTQIATTAFVNAEIANDAAPIAHVGSTGTAHGVATTTVAGFMSSVDKTKLDGVATDANNYTLPTATSAAIGGVKVSSTAQTVAANAVSATAAKTYAVQLDASGNAVVNVPWVDTNVTTVENVLNSTSTTNALSAAQGKALQDSKAPLASPTFTGTPVAPTASVGTSTTQIATTGYVVAEINKIEEW